MRPGARRTRRREGRGSRGPAEEQFHGRGAGRGGEDVDGFGDEAVGDVGAGWGGGVPEGEVLQAAADLAGAVLGVSHGFPPWVLTAKSRMRARALRCLSFITYRTPFLFSVSPSVRALVT